MFYALPEYPDLDTLIRAVLPQDQRDDIEKIVINYDSDVVQGLGAGGASTAKGATVYFKDEKAS